MIRISQHKALSSFVKTNIWYVSCPFCFGDIAFYNASPVMCPKCREELPDYMDLIENIDIRKEYYKIGKKWEIFDSDTNDTRSIFK
jgi:hypothetical protein